MACGVHDQLSPQKVIPESLSILPDAREVVLEVLPNLWSAARGRIGLSEVAG
jgi:hypothetical protein